MGSNKIISMTPETQISNKSDWLVPDHESKPKHVTKQGKLLLNAARKGDSDVVRNLLAEGLPLVTDFLGMTPLHYAAQHGHLDTCNIIIHSGIQKETRSKVEKTPLHLASTYGYDSICLLLLANGANINAQDMIFMTPLHWAAEKGHANVVQLLLQNGADPNLLNKFDKSPLDIAIENNFTDIVALIKKGSHEGEYSIISSDRPCTPSSFSTVVVPTVVMDEEVHTSGEESEIMIELESDPLVTDFLANDVNNTKKVELPLSTLQMLQKHGIQIFSEDENISMVTTAVDSGQTVILTEAGKQALNMTKQIVEPNAKAILDKMHNKRKNDEIEMQITNLKEKYREIQAEAEFYENLAQRKRNDAVKLKNEIRILHKKLFTT